MLLYRLNYAQQFGRAKLVYRLFYTKLLKVQTFWNESTVFYGFLFTFLNYWVKTVECEYIATHFKQKQLNIFTEATKSATFKVMGEGSNK